MGIAGGPRENLPGPTGSGEILKGFTSKWKYLTGSKPCPLVMEVISDPCTRLEQGQRDFLSSHGQ